jgi:hypothetical protein
VREPQKVKEAEEEAEEEAEAAAEAFDEEAGLSPAFISLESRRVFSFALKKFLIESETSLFWASPTK